MISRRQVLSALAVLPLASPAIAAGDHASIGYMKQAAKDLLAAHRQGTVSAFLRAVQRHADLPEISMHALGKYSGKLQSSQKAKYQKGVATYIARYFALQSRDYTVAKYEVGEARAGSDGEVMVDTKVYLLTGQVYPVKWKLVWRGGRYKVRDASVLGFWLTNFQRGDFVEYLGKRDGNINQLIAALYG